MPVANINNTVPVAAAIAPKNARFNLDELSPLQPLTKKLLKETSLATARAFVDSPGYAWMFSGVSEESKVGRLEWLFKKNYQIQFNTGACRMSVDKDGKLACFFLFERESDSQLGNWSMLKKFWKMPFKFGMKPVKKLFQTVDYYDPLMEKAIESTLGKNGKYYMLERMTVMPEMQGKGVGTHCLKIALGEARENNLPVFLTATEERVVRFYKRLGFQTIHQEDWTPEDGVSIPQWVMAYNLSVNSCGLAGAESAKSEE